MPNSQSHLNQATTIKDGWQRNINVAIVCAFLGILFGMGFCRRRRCRRQPERHASRSRRTLFTRHNGCIKEEPYALLIHVELLKSGHRISLVTVGIYQLRRRPSKPRPDGPPRFFTTLSVNYTQTKFVGQNGTGI